MRKLLCGEHEGTHMAKIRLKGSYSLAGRAVTLFRYRI